MTTAPQTFTFTTSDPLQLAALAQGLASYNANNPQNILADTQAFFQFIVGADITARAQQILAAEQAAADAAMAAGNLGPEETLLAQEQAAGLSTQAGS